jgi:hypothetical protein
MASAVSDDNGPDERLSIGDAAARLGVSPQTLRRWDRAGTLRAERSPGARHRSYSTRALQSFARATGRALSPGREVTAPPLVGVPARSDAHVGRAEDLLLVGSLLGDGLPLITLVGPPGIGKTHFVVELIHRVLAPRAAAAIYFCALSPVRHADEVARVVAAALALRLPGVGTAEVTQVARALPHRGRALIVLYNFEQLTPHAAATVGVWREAAPQITWLVTSREPLKLRGELIYDLGPLALPAEDEAPCRAAESEAVQLFLLRAAAGGGAGAAIDLAAAAAIVRRLDGVPLAIELAARRAAALGCATVARSLAQQLDFLTTSRSRRQGSPARRACPSARAYATTPPSS